ncbi:MAG: hypothetical protein H0V70_07155 [Ktedonobacteraceae bacterium]|nr:hypothetical protein [Ktedonobacteraceae bacterium]
MAGVDQIVKLDGQLGTVIDTLLFIARAMMAVFYSRVTHGLRDDENEPDASTDEEVRTLITDATKEVVAEAITAIYQGIITQLETCLWS